MHNDHINYLGNMPLVLLFFFQHQALWKKTQNSTKHSLDLFKRSACFNTIQDGGGWGGKKAPLPVFPL